MSSLFIELYLDEDVSVLVAELVRSRGFSVTTTRECGQLGKGDEEQLEFAVSNHKTLLTHNRVDFENLAAQYFAEQKTHFGIIIAARRSPYELAQRLLDILNGLTAEEMASQLVYI